MSETSQAERRSPERLKMEQNLRAHEDWLSSLDSRVESGKLTPEDRNRFIALAFIRREKKLEREQKKNELDSMTGLYRQEHLRKTLESRIKQGKPFALLFTDLDKFGAINKDYGQSAGDEIIMQAALRITEQLRESNGEDREEDMPFRNGGDETAIILPGIDTAEKLEIVAEKIRDSMESAPFHIPFTNTQIPLTVSIGGIIWNGENMEEFMDKASQSLKEAKTQRNVVAIK